MTDGTPEKLETRTEPPPVSATALQAVYHSVSEAIFIHDKTGDIIDVNQAAAEMYGYSRSALRDGDVGPISSGEPPYTDANASERIKRAVEGETQTFEWQGKDSDGTVFWEEVSLSRTIVDGDPRVLAIVRDIDDRKRAEHRFQTLINNLPGMVYRCRNEPGWPMLFVGGQCKDLTGYRPDVIQSNNVSWGDDIIHPTDRKRLQQPVESAIAAGEAFEVTYRIRTADGDIRWVWERGQQVDVPQRRATVLEGFITDVTEQYEYKQQVESQRDDLEILSQVVRHDIRNDLQLVLAFAETIDQYPNEDGNEYVDKILSAAHNAVDITTTARDVTEVMLKPDIDHRPIPLRSTLESEIEELRSTHEHSLVRLNESVPDVDVWADPMLESVFRNLLGNAIQHSDKDVPEVVVSATASDEMVRVQIADNGPGVPDDRKEAIFEQGEMGIDSDGTGLGLYLVTTLVGRYGGDVRIEDNDPRGALILVTLPIADSI